MRINAFDEEYIQIALSETNVQHLIQYGKLVLFGGSPHYPAVDVELILESDDRHYDTRIEQLDGLRSSDD